MPKYNNINIIIKTSEFYIKFIKLVITVCEQNDSYDYYLSDHL